MKRRIITSLKSLLAGVLVLSAMTAAHAQLGLGFTSGQTTYVAGQVNNFTFTVTGGGSTGQWIDRVSITVPAAWTVNSAGPNGNGGCATNSGLLQVCSPTASWTKNVNVPCGTGAFGATFCGWWQNGAAQNYTMAVNVPAGTTGPQTITMQGTGESGTIQTITVTLTAFVPPAPCVLVCPGNLNYNLDPGACTQVVNYDVFTTGVCQIVQQTCGFVGVLAPAEVDFWQVGLAAGNGLPPQGNSGSGPHVLFDDAGAACAATADRLTLRSVLQVGGFCHNGVEWDLNNAAPTTVQFDWNYNQPVSSWDQFAVGIGTDANHFGINNNNFCGNPFGYWQFLTPLLIGVPQNLSGTFVANIPANGWLSFSASTQVQTGQQPATITITNITSTQIVPAVPVQYSGLPSGSEFPIGTTTNCYRVDLAPANNPAGDLTCCFNVNVVEFPNPIASLVCNDLVYVSLDEDCSYCLGADGVLEGGPYHCYDDYI
ncbi:MAG TPA: hypothetical protein VK168_02300, partial [Saprospiraceae bacterium]|nr:hypothetical protein [Saprospiraceae bacterium]